MRLFEVTEPTGCPRTKATDCSCDRLRQLAEAEQTIEAVAVLGHGDAKGMISFKQKPGKATIISGTITGLSEGKHGFHIHEFGDLSDGCDSAGGHYNPTGVDHGDIDNGHVGDLGNITADNNGVAKFSIKAKRIHLQGATSIVGRAVVVHEDEDDLGKGGDEESLKTGNAGKRAGCGVISLRELTESAIAKTIEDLPKNITDKHFSRSEMPQVKRPHLEKSKIPHEDITINVADLKPVQSERVKGLAQDVADDYHSKDKPFILDKDNYLVNGHHRYDAARWLGIEQVKAIKVDVPIELLMKKFSHTRSNAMAEDVVGMNPQAVKPYFSPQEADRANDEWVNQAQVDQEDGVIVKGTDDKQYRIMTSYNNEHFEDGEVYLDGLTDPTYIDPEGYPDAAELLYYHSATGHYPDDELDENFADGKKKGKSRPGRVKRSGASCKGSVTSLRAKAKKYSGERGKMYHWCANMKGGKKKKNESLMASTFDTEFVQKAKELYNAGQQGQLVRHIYKFSKENSERIHARPELKKMLQDIFYEVSDNFQDEEQIDELLFIIDDTLSESINESAFENLKLPDWVMHTTLEKLFAQEYGPRYGDYVAHMDLDSNDNLSMNAGGEMSAMAFELAKVHDIKVMQDFLAQMPVQFTVDELELVDGIQKWHLVQQNKTVH